MTEYRALNDELDTSADKAVARILLGSVLAKDDEAGPLEELIRREVAAVQRETLLVAAALAQSIETAADPDPTNNRASRWSSDGDSISFR